MPPETMSGIDWRKSPKIAYSVGSLWGPSNIQGVGVQAVLKSSKQLEPMLEWCLIASLLAHALILFGLPKPQMDTPPPKRDEIKIELVQPPPPAPVTPPAPQPEPVKPPPKPIPPKLKTPTPVPQKVTPVSEPPAEPPRPVTEPAPPNIIAVKPSVSESKPEVVVPPPPPPPEPVRPTGPSEGDYEAARAAFREAAQREIQKNLRYPRMAMERGIEGITHLHVSFDDLGNIVNVEVTESSGNKALDDAAIATIRKSQFKALFNDILRGRLKSTNVPVSFKLVS